MNGLKWFGASIIGIESPSLLRFLSNNQTERLQRSCRVDLVQPYATGMLGNRRLKEARFMCNGPLYYNFLSAQSLVGESSLIRHSGRRGEKDDRSISGLSSRPLELTV